MKPSGYSHEGRIRNVAITSRTLLFARIWESHDMYCQSHQLKFNSMTAVEDMSLKAKKR